MNGMADFDISRLLGSLYRRKYFVGCIWGVIFSLSVYTAAIVPNIYESSSLILVVPQRVPSSFVTSTITTDLGERMQSIIQEILSRTQLAKIVQEFNLYPFNRVSSSVEDRVERLRKAIKVELRRNNVFQLSFESQEPEKAQQITARIASLFIEQNLQIRKQQAVGTKSFMNAEADRLRKELEEQETIVNRYKAAHRYELPEQLDSNLRTLEQLRREMEASNVRVTTLQERKGILQRQSAESDVSVVDPIRGALLIPAEDGSQSLQLQMRKKELDALLQKYSSKHPDVIRIKREIETLESEPRDGLSGKVSTSVAASTGNPLKQVLRNQIAEIDAELQTLQKQRQQISVQIGTLQSRVDATPIRAIELSKISRGYEITLRKYQDLLGKTLESELSENMEKKQEGERFQLLDAANFPLKPLRPNRLMIGLIGFLLGLGGGVGLAIVWDNWDTSFRKSDDINAYVNVPVLATIPALVTRGSVIEQRRSQSVLVFASLGALVVGAVLVRIFAPMYF
jgi:polysaccharide chain length determinant protein (PEP-CTERM system associated)